MNAVMLCLELSNSGAITRVLHITDDPNGRLGDRDQGISATLPTAAALHFLSHALEQVEQNTQLGSCMVRSPRNIVQQGREHKHKHRNDRNRDTQTTLNHNSWPTLDLLQYTCYHILHHRVFISSQSTSTSL